MVNMQQYYFLKSETPLHFIVNISTNMTVHFLPNSIVDLLKDLRWFQNEHRLRMVKFVISAYTSVKSPDDDYNSLELCENEQDKYEIENYIMAHYTISNDGNIELSGCLEFVNSRKLDGGSIVLEGFVWVFYY